MGNRVRVAAVSDLHGLIPPTMPESDIVLIAGDLTMHHSVIDASLWLGGPFADWVESLSVPVYAIAGNHDFIYESKTAYLLPNMPSNYHYLRDELTEFEGLTIFGSPWTKMYNNWSFMKTEENLDSYFDRVVPEADIYVMHSPVYGVLDYSPYDKVHTGSFALRNIVDKVQPLLYVHGHIHSEYGVVEIGRSVVANVSLVDEEYRSTRKPMLFEINDGQVNF